MPASASGARVVGILTPQYLASDYCAAEWIHALDGDPLNRKGRLIVLRAAECEPKGLLRTLAYWDLEPIRGRDDLLADIVKSAILSDAERRLSGTAGAHWREARALFARGDLADPELHRTRGASAKDWRCSLVGQE